MEWFGYLWVWEEGKFENVLIVVDCLFIVIGRSVCVFVELKVDIEFR